MLPVGETWGELTQPLEKLKQTVVLGLLSAWDLEMDGLGGVRGQRHRRNRSSFLKIFLGTDYIGEACQGR